MKPKITRRFYYIPQSKLLDLMEREAEIIRDIKLEGDTVIIQTAENEKVE